MTINPDTGSFIYTDPTDATSAAPGNVIRSSVWNQIFTDLQNGLNQIIKFNQGTTVTTITANATLADVNQALIVNAAGTVTLTLPTPANYKGRWLNLKTVAANAVVSASSNVVPQATTAAGTAILAATAGKFARMTSDGTNWIIMESN